MNNLRTNTAYNLQTANNISSSGGGQINIGYNNVNAGLGVITDLTRIVITGHRKNITSSGFFSNSDSIPLNGLDISFPSSAGTLYIISTSTNDTSAGTGARTVIITGLDNNYDPKTEIINLNGQTSVATVDTDWLRVNVLQVIVAGSTDNNVGIISISDVDSFTAGGLPITSVIATIEEETNASTQGHFTTRAGYAFLTSVFKFSTDATEAKSLSLRASFKPFGIPLVRGVELTANSNFNYLADGFISIPEKSDIQILTMANATTVSMATIFWSGILYKTSTYPNAT